MLSTAMLFCFAPLACVLSSDEWLTTTGRPVDHAVVLAKVVSSTEGRISEFGIEVERVFSGSSILEGVRFFGTNREEGSAFVFTLHPKPVVGGVGIWLVPDEPEGGKVEAYTMRRMIQVVPIGLPARQADKQRPEDFDQALVWAQAIEKLESLDADERIEQLKEYAASENPILSVWAIHVLDIVHKDVEFLQSLATVGTLPLLAQIALDEAMMRLNPEHWRDSLERQQMLTRWNVRAIESNDDAMAIVIRLSSAVQRREIEPQKFFESLRPIITGELRAIVKGEPHSLDVRAHALGTTRWIVNDPVVRDDVFSLLVDILESDESDRLKNVAAGVLRTVTTLKLKQNEYVSELRDHYAALAAETDDKHALIHRIAALLEETVNNLTPDEQVE